MAKLPCKRLPKEPECHQGCSSCYPDKKDDGKRTTIIDVKGYKPYEYACDEVWTALEDPEVKQITFIFKGRK